MNLHTVVRPPIELPVDAAEAEPQSSILEWNALPVPLVLQFVDEGVAMFTDNEDRT